MKALLVQKIPETKFVCHSKQQGQLVYHESLDASDLMSGETDTIMDVDTTDESDDTSGSIGMNMKPSFAQEYNHVCQVVEASMSTKVPRNFDNWPPSLDDFSVESSLKYAPEELYNIIAYLTSESCMLRCYPQYSIFTFIC